VSNDARPSGRATAPPRGMPPTSAIMCSSPTPAGRLSRPIRESGSGRRRTCSRWRSCVGRARLRPSSTSRRRSEPRRRPRCASAAGREKPDRSSAIQLLADVFSFARGAIFSRTWVHFSATGTSELNITEIRCFTAALRASYFLSLRTAGISGVCGAFGGRVLSQDFAAGVGDRLRSFALPAFAPGF